MNIIYLHQYFKFPDEFGGTRSFDLSTGFLGLGHYVEVITATSDLRYKTSKRWSKIEKNDLVVHYIYMPYSNDMTYLKRSLVFIKFLWFSTLKLLSLRGYTQRYRLHREEHRKHHLRTVCKTYH